MSMASKTSSKKRWKPLFHRNILPFATETSLAWTVRFVDAKTLYVVDEGDCTFTFDTARTVHPRRSFADETDKWARV
jgi:hypothetical protein